MNQESDVGSQAARRQWDTHDTVNRKRAESLPKAKPGRA
jgi:hypothetical protein